ncbi:hypothetical protein LCGC14_2287820, partial [marine sediment metagenome]
MNEFSELDLINRMYEENVDEDRYFDETLVNRRRHKMKKGEVYKVFEDPYTKTKLEGVAKITKVIDLDMDDGFYRCLVKFNIEESSFLRLV